VRIYVRHGGQSVRIHMRHHAVEYTECGSVCVGWLFMCVMRLFMCVMRLFMCVMWQSVRIYMQQFAKFFFFLNFRKNISVTQARRIQKTL